MVLSLDSIQYLRSFLKSWVLSSTWRKPCLICPYYVLGFKKSRVILMCSQRWSSQLALSSVTRLPVTSMALELTNPRGCSKGPSQTFSKVQSKAGETLPPHLLLYYKTILSHFRLTNEWVTTFLWVRGFQSWKNSEKSKISHCPHPLAQHLSFL